MSNAKRTLTRRNILRGAGVALTLPWLESLAPRSAKGQAVLPRPRFVAMYFPCGVADYWAPTGTGSGDAWQLSPILAPLAPLKNQVSVLSHVGNYSPWGGHIEPSNSNLTGAFLTCTRANGPGSAYGGTSVDQVIAKDLRSFTHLSSLQVGLSTLDSYTDGLPGPHSRSISWASPSQPLYKIIDPQAVFDRLFGVVAPVPDTRAGDKSVLDQVIAQASSMQAALSTSDRVRLDEFLTSVRAVEANIAGQPLPPACAAATRPTESYSVDGTEPADYNRDTHANIMIDLVALALQCDLTRVVSFMLDDSRSDYVYDFLTARTFTSTGSVPGPSTATLGGLDGLANAGSTNNGWATINYWFVEKLTRLCQKMQAVQDGPGGTVLDQSLVWFGSEMHGANNDGLDLPLLYVGSGGGRLKVNQHFDFASRPTKSEDLASIYLTFLRRVFDFPETSFGKPVGNYVTAGRQIVPEVLV
jgi:uncharacterized protein DUF1552